MITVRKMDAVSLMSTLSTLLLIGCALVGAKPAHEVQKRATVAEVLGDLTAGASGILNEDSKYCSYSYIHCE